MFGTGSTSRPGKWPARGVIKEEKAMANFMYLFRANPAEAYRSLSPEQMQQLTQRWMDWRATLEKKGHTQQLGERLDGTGKVVRGKGKTVTNGPDVEVKDFIQGYMVVTAADVEQALEL